MENDELGLVRALGFVAWADDRIAPEEKAMLETVMQAIGVPAERRFAIAQAILMARADGEFVEAERQKIEQLAGALGVDGDELNMLYAAVDVTDSLMDADTADGAG